MGSPEGSVQPAPISGVSISSLLSGIQGTAQENTPLAQLAAATAKAPAMVFLGQGIPSIPKKMAERILSGEYIDFAELPPAKTKQKQVAAPTEGNILLVQTCELLQNRKPIADLATWLQCFGCYMAVVTARHPARVPDLLGYMLTIVKASRQFRWPSWVVYDQNFRLEAAEKGLVVWSKVDPSLFSLCFTGQATSAESWCKHCQGLDHGSDQCLGRPAVKKPQLPNAPRPWRGGAASGLGPTEGTPVCFKYNRYNGDCIRGARCRYRHVCLTCEGDHPKSKCATKTPGKGGIGEKSPR